MRHLANIGLLILLILGLAVAAYKLGMALVLLVILGIFRLARLRKNALAGSNESSSRFHSCIF
ncbi:hypothetical protein BED98_18030 [Salmonella enterica subsp. enterica serovar Cerro]|uniref:Uncharacterized protein n=1 Tax=Salmonella enterica TaxID=28901 RepID=A0A724CB92_SALER|nr:hypothetical protein [Salmonella enterica]EBV1289483.1 hypothetical protein [Salmonella enterica subsp. enterica serovar Stanley]EBZ3278178.1 hypothetical protein [Salmonella enterica subsp. enterica serovar Montevideo]ECH8034813.1 hypothetical protein [Salmonella enterica subsp. enterica]ECT7562176.1 hypothetical protein [Salmonella enterica subsp. enterica serovar Cerro]EGR1113125.1 hypothetical protein [Vibrio cholerae]ODL11251.1 hypothetical protein BFG33_11535 [Salmonella enterica sub